MTVNHDYSQATAVIMTADASRDFDMYLGVTPIPYRKTSHNLGTSFLCYPLGQVHLLANHSQTTLLLLAFQGRLLRHLANKSHMICKVDV